VVNGSLICKKHSRPIEKHPELVFRCGAIIPKQFSAGGLTIIFENDLKCFCMEWGAIETRGVSAKINKVNGQVLIKTGPEVCESCIGEKRFQMLQEDEK